MGYPAYLYPNLISSTGGFSLSTEDAIYTHLNAFDGRMNKPFRFAAKSNQRFRHIFPTPFQFDTVVVVNHNWTSAVTAAFVYGGATQDAAPALTYEDMDRPRNIYYRLATPVTKAWCGINVSDPTNSQNPEFGQLIVGLSVTLADMFEFGWEKGRPFFNDPHTTEFGSKTVYEKYAVRTRRLPWVDARTSTDIQIEALYTLVRGDLRPFVLIPDLGDPLCIFGRLINPYGATNRKFNRYNEGLEFTEESRGVTLT